MPAGDRDSKEAGIPGGIPTVAQALLPLGFLSGLTNGCGGDCYTEKDNQSPGHKVASTLLGDLWLLQE